MKMEEWKECKLSEIMDLIGGGTPKTSNPDYWGGDIPWISVKDFNGERRYVGDTEKKITKLGLENSSTKILSKGDIIISARGTVGELAIIPSDMAFNQSCYGLRAKDFVDSCFLYYLLKQSVNILKHNTHGSVFDTITRETFENISVKLPPLPTQQKIAAILSSLDDKIELNNKINTNLEQQAGALFKNWFVDFEPFGGKMPEGWKEGTVSEIIVLHDSKRIPLSSQQREKMEKKYPYYGATSLMDYVDNYLFDGIFLLLGEDGTVIDSEGFPILQYVEGKFWVNNHAHILTGKNGFSVEMLYLLFSLTNVKDKVTGAVQQKISQGNLNSITTIIPPEEVCKKFDLLIQPLFAQIRNLKQENDRLSELRDTLLPKLMNGEIEVGIK
ncbi:MAG: restriction endonuclease subunit S [Candidatus Treponema excrementipullorum]|nr:restriction endonuclease subunit S [Candidatus Treponema excrementipullorum]MDY4465308.1 restriction endonuclease subunit S [Candidatus Treponema excrementipullorum]